ncbi:MAG TPA: glycosyltransferase family 9 protein [Usitatibacter sp.]|nr:glycosyltransferase family 9 protein [Usitatibacter sp.]
MNIGFMRKVDYFAGVPLCFVATFYTWIADRLRRRASEAPRKVLFVELSEMGSAILADPAMRKMREAGGAELHFAIFAANAASLRLLGTVPRENVFTIRHGNLLTLAVDSLRFLAWTRRRGIDTVIDLELFSRYSALLTGLSGAAHRVGFHAFHNEGLYRGAMLTRRVLYNPHRHIARNFVALVNAALAERAELPYSKAAVGDEEIRLARAPEDAAAVERMRARIRERFPAYDPSRHRVVLINPNASDLLPQRRWMPERFVEVMRGLLAGDPALLVIITGSPDEREGAEALRAQVGDARCLSFAGLHALEELPALYRIAEVLLTNDSGAGHFSAVTDVRAFVLFGPETPALYGSLGNATPIYAGLACSPCVSAANHRRTPCTDNVCLKVIPAQAVLEQLREALAEGRSR